MGSISVNSATSSLPPARSSAVTTIRWSSDASIATKPLSRSAPTTANVGNRNLSSSSATCWWVNVRSTASERRFRTNLSSFRVHRRRPARGSAGNCSTIRFPDSSNRNLRSRPIHSGKSMITVRAPPPWISRCVSRWTETVSRSSRATVSDWADKRGGRRPIRNVPVTRGVWYM